MPNRAITATRKLIPRSKSLEPNVMRSCPDTVSIADARGNRPSAIEITVLCLSPRPSPTRSRTSEYTAKNSGGPNLSANDEIPAQERDQKHRDQRADERRVEGAVSASAAAPAAPSIAVEGGRRPTTPRPGC